MKTENNNILIQQNTTIVMCGCTNCTLQENETKAVFNEQVQRGTFKRSQGKNIAIENNHINYDETSQRTVRTEDQKYTGKLNGST